MKIAVFSDIHSNFTAFRACAEKAVQEHADEMIFLGDYLTDCAYPMDTMNLVYELRQNYPCHCILGNREEYLLRYRDGSENWSYSSKTGSLLYTYESIGERELDFFSTLKKADCLYFSGLPAITICHGTPEDNRKTMDADSCREWFGRMEKDYLFCGHTHRFMDEREGTKRIVNFGSVGMQVDGYTEARMGFLCSDGNSWRLEPVQVAYDVSAELDRIAACGLREKAGVWVRSVSKTLATGENYVVKCLQLAAELAAKDGISGSCPEIYWQRAAEELELPVISS